MSKAVSTSRILPTIWREGNLEGLSSAAQELEAEAEHPAIKQQSQQQDHHDMHGPHSDHRVDAARDHA